VVSLIYFLIVNISVLFEKIYYLFSHGVESVFFRYLFCYPLACFAVFVSLSLFVPKIRLLRLYRVFFNFLNSGVALMMTGNILRGVLDIAGSDSPYIPYFWIFGAVFIENAILVILVNAIYQPHVD